MGFRVKILIIISCTIIVLMFALLVVEQNTLKQSFMKLENADINMKVNSLVKIIHFDLTSIDQKLSDWAKWDDSYNFMQSKSEKFIESNLGQQTFISLNLDAMVFLDRNSKVFFHKTNSEINTTSFQKNIDKLLEELKSNFHESNKNGKSLKGILVINDEVFLVAGQPILTSNNSGNSNGFLLFCKRIDSNKQDLCS